MQDPNLFNVTRKKSITETMIDETINISTTLSSKGGILPILTYLIRAFCKHVPYFYTKGVKMSCVSHDWFIQQYSNPMFCQN